jgi:amidase
MSRYESLRTTAALRLTASALATGLAVLAPAANADPNGAPTQFSEMTVAQLQSAMASGQTTSVALTNFYINRILKLDQNGPGVNAVIELNPDAMAMAQNADQLRAKGKVLGPLHGIPVLVKDNVDTGDRMQTTAGSFALFGTPAVRDSTVAANLRAGGAVILGKTNLSEWANFRSFESISGWSGRGGQTNNPYGINRNPCGSSSGSAAAATANFAGVSFGSETDGSIVCPGNVSNVAAIKPTIGLTSRAGVVPISHTQDTIGPHGRTVADAAAALGVIQSRTFDGRDAATGGVPLGWQGTGRTRPPPCKGSQTSNCIPSDYTQFLNPNGLQGARLGLTRQGLGGFDPFVPTPQPVVDAFEAAFAALTAAGATVINLDDPTQTGGATFNFAGGPGEFEVICYDFAQFKATSSSPPGDVGAYFATRVNVPVAGGTLQAAIDFNNAHADVEMPFFNQDIFDLCNSLAPGADDPQPAFGGTTYNQALQQDHDFAVNNVDAALTSLHLDAIVSATDNPAWATDLVFGDHFIFGTSSIAAAGGYPIVQVPASMVFGVPMGISFFGTAFSEPTLIKLASGWEAFTHVRADNPPTFSETVPFNNIQGTTLTKHAKAPPIKPPRSKMPKHL